MQLKYFIGGLSGKLLMLTIIFVMIAEVLIFVPSIANFRKNWLQERVERSYLAALAILASSSEKLPKMLRDELLKSAGVLRVSVKHGGARNLVIESDIPKPVAVHYYLGEATTLNMIADALQALISPPGRIIRIIGRPQRSPEAMIDIVLMEDSLIAAMRAFAFRVLLLSIAISVITAALIYFTVNHIFIRPTSALSWNMKAFSQNPEDRRLIIKPSGRRDEIGEAERQLASMQTALADMLQQKSRLAELGLAVSKISHDLRNMLASAQLISDRLGAIDNPAVKRFAPRLIASLDRAITLCTRTMKFGKAREDAPQAVRFPLQALAAELRDELMFDEASPIRFITDIPDNLYVEADRRQLYRVLANLIRNSRQALEAAAGSQQIDPETGELSRFDRAGQITLSARRSSAAVVLTIADNGPGIPGHLQATLFQAFQSSTKRDGNGLGLSIAAELVRAHGGQIALQRSDANGTIFVITLPGTGA